MNVKKNVEKLEWETVKFQCAERSKAFSAKIQSKKKELLSNLYKYCDIVEQEVDNSNITDSLKLVKDKIFEIENERVESSMFCSRCNWQKYGCKPSKYFMSLEKRNFNNKTMFAIKLPDGYICKEQKRILQEQIEFYWKLYKTDPKIGFSLINNYNVKITNEHCEMLDKPLEWLEIINSLKDMAKNKVCGCDALSVEWYLCFFDNIGELLHEMYLEIYNEGIMTKNYEKRGYNTDSKARLRC